MLFFKIKSFFYLISFHIFCFEPFRIQAGLIPQTITSNNSKTEVLYNAVDSDYFMLYQTNSSLPIKNVGSGVFAKYDIPAQSIICEYRGPIVSASDYAKIKGNDKAYSITGPDGSDYKILGDNICAYINDCTAALNRPYTIDEWKFVNNSDYRPGIPCIDNYSYNADPLYHKSGKLFVIALRNILKDEEIFFPYGWQYWKTRMKIIDDNKLLSFVAVGNDMILMPIVEDK